MSTVRHCDGPGCLFSTAIDEPGAPPIPGMGALAKNGWWRVTDLGTWQDVYFHSLRCLVNWVATEGLMAEKRKTEVQ